MKLIDILVQELPKRGGWPEGYYRCAQNIYGEVIFETLPEGFQVSATTIFTFGSLAEDFADEEVTREQYEAALKQPVWDGTGLPPVGVEIEYMKYERGYNDEWYVGKIYYKSDFTVVIAQKDHVGEIVGHPVNFKFRPIRSEEERKRDAEVDELIDAITLTLADIYASQRLMDAIAAGMIPGVKLSD